MPDETPLRDYYAARAPEYERVYAKPERQADLRAIERWVPGVFEGRRVLEVACGTGYWTPFIASAAATVLAIDAAPETLRIARAKAVPATVEFAFGDAYALPRTGQRFDGGFAGFWFSHVPRSRWRAFLDGFHAALVPGAVVVLLDNLFVAGSTAIAAVDDDGNAYQDRALSDGSTHRVLKNFPVEAELRAALGGAADDVRYLAWPHYWALQYTLANSSPA